MLLLTTKPGEFKTEVTAGLSPVETYDYIFYGRKRANFTIAELDGADDDPHRRGRAAADRQRRPLEALREVRDARRGARRAEDTHHLRHHGIKLQKV